MGYSRKSRGKKSYAKTASTARRVAGNAFRLAKFLKGVVNAEKKTYAKAITTAIGTTPIITDISDIAQGDDFFNRDGRSVLSKSLFVRSIYSMNASAGFSTVRVAVVMDTMNQGDAPAWTDVFVATNVISPKQAGNNNGYNGRFKVLHDKIINLQIFNVAQKQDYCFKKLDHHIYFEGTASTDAAKNAIYLMQLSNEATNTVVQNTYTTLKYYDN